MNAGDAANDEKPAEPSCYRAAHGGVALCSGFVEVAPCDRWSNSWGGVTCPACLDRLYATEPESVLRFRARWHRMGHDLAAWIAANEAEADVIEAFINGAEEAVLGVVASVSTSVGAKEN